MKTGFTVDYFKNPKGEGEEWSHSYDETWELDTDLFCPGCGKSGYVWHESSGGDYYVGEQFICIECGSEFFLPSGVDKAIGKQNEQRIKHIKDVASIVAKSTANNCVQPT